MKVELASLAHAIRDAFEFATGRTIHPYTLFIDVQRTIGVGSCHRAASRTFRVPAL
jgi:hypothetical protein